MCLIEHAFVNMTVWGYYKVQKTTRINNGQTTSYIFSFSFQTTKKWVEWLQSDKRSEGDLFDSWDQQSAIRFTCCLSQNEFQELVMKLILSSREDFQFFLTRITIQCNIKRFYFLSGCICSEEYFLSWRRRLVLLIISTIWDIRRAELLMGKMNMSVHSWFEVPPPPIQVKLLSSCIIQGDLHLMRLVCEFPGSLA